MTSTALLEIAEKRQSEIDDAVANFLAQGGQVQSFEKKDHEQAQRDYRKARRLQCKAHRKAALAKL